MIGIIVGLVIGIILTIFVIKKKYTLTSNPPLTVKSPHTMDETQYLPEEPVKQIEVDAVDQVKLISNPAYTTASNDEIQEDIYQILTTATLRRQELNPQNMRDDGAYLIPSCETMNDFTTSTEDMYASKTIPPDTKLDEMATPIMNTIGSTTDDTVYGLLNTAGIYIPDAFGFSAVDE
jgi:uncharacterized protein YneF (UPF0154 family)